MFIKFKSKSVPINRALLSIAFLPSLVAFIIFTDGYFSKNYGEYIILLYILLYFCISAILLKIWK